MPKWLQLAATAGIALLLAGCGGTASHDATWHTGYRYGVAKHKVANNDLVHSRDGGDPDYDWCTRALPDDMLGTTPAVSDWIAGCEGGLQATIGEPEPPAGGRM